METNFEMKEGEKMDLNFGGFDDDN